MKKSVKVLAPASVANVGCGYDTMGFAISGVYEEIIVHSREDDQLVIRSIKGANLSSDPEQNVATIAAASLLNDVGVKAGFDFEIIKHFKPGSGLGSSASSAAGAVFAVNHLLDSPLPTHSLLRHALEGEAFASKCYHADNVAPSLLGGFQVARSYTPLELFKVETGLKLKVLIVFPDVQVKTAESKGLLPKEISIEVARNQWANSAALVHALNTANLELLKKSVEDHIAEPVRKSLIPKYDEVKRIAEQCGAWGFNISGSGPSTFAFFTEESSLLKMERIVHELYSTSGINIKTYRSKIDPLGCRVIS